MPMANDTDNRDKDRFDASQFKYMGIGFEFAGSVIILAAVGYFVDRHWNVGPWGVLIGSLVGIVTGMYVLLKETLKISKDQDKRDRQ